MVNGEVTPVRVPSEQVVLLFIYDQFLREETGSWDQLVHGYRVRLCASEP